jgi:hypothetical protein
MVLLPLGLDTPSLRLEGSNATHHPKFNIVRDIPGSGERFLRGKWRRKCNKYRTLSIDQNAVR